MGIKDLEDLKKLSMLKSQIDAISVKDIVVADFPTLGPDDTLSDSLALMRKTGYMEIPVVDGGAYIGMMRYGTILKKKSTTPETKIRTLVSSLPTLTEDAEITKVAEHMVTENCRQLAVVNGKRAVGIVSRTALIRIAAQMKSLRDIKVWEIMTTPVECVTGNSMLSEAIDTMRDLDIRTLPVIDSAGRLAGVVGMREVIDNGWKQGIRSIGTLSKSPSSQIPVESVAVTAVLSCDWEDRLDVAVDIMAEKGISTLPVMDSDELVGILTEFDIIELISACRERDQLYVQISGLGEEDKIYADPMYSDIAAEVEKISKIYKPESLTIHVARYNESGERKKYSLVGKLFVDGRVVNAKEVGWDLVQVNKDLVKRLSDEVKDIKDSHVSFRKRKK
ncbi:CBS domain-containing protein [Methanomassiliicoccaceae archaeon COG_1]|nr:CBS domain-containing protein [Methanomassiliicoccaceae archaeon COG_1]